MEGFAFSHTARQEGLQVGQDAAKNLIIALSGREAEKPFIASGSHLDSVPQGGNFDGAAGVIAALTAVVHLKRAGIVPPRTVKVFAFRAEESAWFGKSWLGSNAMFGLLTEKDLGTPRSTSGQSLRDAMMATGVDLDSVGGQKRLIDPAQIAAFLELHIEQGPVMVATASKRNVAPSKMSGTSVFRSTDASPICRHPWMRGGWST